MNYFASFTDLTMALLLFFMLAYIKDISTKKTLVQCQTELKELKDSYTVIDDTYRRINKKLVDGIGADKIDVEKREVKLEAQILFDYNKYDLKPEGEEELRKVLPIFFKTFLDDSDILNYLEQLTIEGHTDDVGNYLSNLELSQKRAYAVSQFIYSDSKIKEILGEKRLKNLKIYLSSNGKGDSMLIYKEYEGKKIIDQAGSRRVTLKYRLDVEKLIKKK